MKIQKVSAINYYSSIPNKINQENKISNKIPYTATPAYGLTFGARVDKGLMRFYEYNKNRMPNTLKNYIETLADKTSLTPLQAQAGAFALLAGIASVEEIKQTYPNEPLFTELKPANLSKATRGVLGAYRENKELLDIDNRTILKNGEDLTTWLVKKIFLDAKTLDEINVDFNKSIDPEFKALYKDKESADSPIRPSTLKALGIQSPEAEYMQSLRYTREGYSDLVGDKISQVQRAFWESMPPEERTARARRSVEKFENWWASLSRNQKLDMIAFQIDELGMLKQFNDSKIGKKGVNKTHKNYAITSPKSEHEKTSSKLCQDDLFKIWAGNNLKIFEAGLSDYDRQVIETKRLQRRVESWKAMTPAEKTEYVNRLRKGAETLRYAIIQAWNENPDILVQLSKTLTKGHIDKPAEILYGTEDFNDFMSDSMTGFWASNSEFAEKFGDSIRLAHEKIKKAKNEGKFEQIKTEILRKRAERIQVTAEEIRNYKEILASEKYKKYPEYMKDFIDAYNTSAEVGAELLPIKYLDDFYNVVNNSLDDITIKSWTKQLRGLDTDDADESNLKQIQAADSFEIFRLNRSIENALAEILYDCTGKCEVFLMPIDQLQQAAKQIANGEKSINISPTDSEEEYIIPVIKNKINTKKLEKLYDKHHEPLSENDADDIIERFFTFDKSKAKDVNELFETAMALRLFLTMYGNSVKIVFTDESEYSDEARVAFLERFKSFAKDFVKPELCKISVDSPDSIIKEDKIIEIDALLRKKYSFLTRKMQDLYIYEMNKILREINYPQLKKFEYIAKCSPNSLKMPEITLHMNRKMFNKRHNTEILCMEQTLADILYSATKEPKFYALTFEELIDCIEVVLTAKNFPVSVKSIRSRLLNESFDTTFRHKMNLYKSEEISKEYLKEMKKYTDEIEKGEAELSQDDFLCVLNPYDGLDEIDNYTRKRIDNIFSYL